MAAPIPPPVLWAQTKSVIFLTINVECANPTIKIEPDSLYFKGTSSQDKTIYEVTIPLYAKINAEKSKSAVKGRGTEMVLVKSNEDEPYWPNLTKDKKKPHWLKIDFNKWVDEDDEEAGGGDNMDSLEEMLRNMGGAAGGEPLSKASMDDLPDDSDDEELPDLE